MGTVTWAIIPGKFSRARSRLTCREYNQLSSSTSSISRPPRRLVILYQPLYLPSPTRLSTKQYCRCSGPLLCTRQASSAPQQVSPLTEVLLTWLGASIAIAVAARAHACCRLAQHRQRD